MHFFCIFFQKYLVNSKKSSTFAPAFGWREHLILLLESKECGNSSVGRARPCQGRGREFESRFPLFFFACRQKGVPENINFWGERRHKLPVYLAERYKPLQPCCRTRAQMAELVDACVSGAHAARCAGSSPVLGTQNKALAQVVKLVYTLLWGGSGRKIVWVRVSSCAQGLKINKLRVRRVKIDPKSAQMTFTDVEVICR